MKTVTNNYKEEITKLGREIDFKIFLYANNKIITENNNFLITQDNMQLVVEQFNENEIEKTIGSEDIYSVSVVNRGELLSTIMKEVDFEISEELKVGDIIDCQFGLKVNNAYEYVDYGKYMIYEKEFNEDTKTYSYIAYNRMLLTMQEIPDTSVYENKTISNVIQEICSITRLDFNAPSIYPNLNKTINEGTFTDLQMTYRDMLDMICQALGLSMIVEDKELVLKNHNDIERTLSGGNKLYIGNAKERNAVSYSVDGVSEQDGTPTPSSPQEIKTIPSIINLFNKDNANIINGFLSDGGTLNSDNIWKTLYMSCKPNTTYTISKISSKAFRVADFQNIPQTGATYIHRTRNDTATTITFTTDNNGNYLAISYYRETDTLTPIEILDTIMIEEGTVSHEYVPYGYYTRVKITGKNLFSGYEVGYINSSNGNDETNNNCHRSFYIPVKPNTTYTTSTLITRFCEYNKNKGFIRCLFNTSNSITTTANTYYLRLGFGTAITTDELDVEMFEEGNTPTTYEQYKENEVLIDMAKPDLFYGELESGDLNSSNGNNETNASRIRTKEFIEVSSSNTYYINSSVSLARIIQYDTNKNFIRYDSASNNPLTTTATTKYIRFSLLTTDTTTNVNIFEGTSPTPYYELCSNKDKTVRDKLVIDSNGNCSIEKKIGKRIFNGSESWELQWQQSGFRTSIPDIKKTTASSQPSYVMSNYYTSDTQDQVFAKNYGICNRANQSQIIIKNVDVPATVNDFKTWLSTHNTVVQYELATPQTINLPNTQIPLFEGINHITLVDDLETDTSVVYHSSDLVITDIDETYLKDTNVSFRKKYGPINSVVLSRSEDSDTIYRKDDESILQNGLCEFKIKDNPILLYDDREDYIDEIFNNLKGIEYYPTDFSSIGITYLDWGDYYNVNIGDKTYKCLMLDDDIRVEQGLEENVYSEVPEETVTNYKTSSKTDKEVSFIVDKQKGQISAKVNKGDVINEINLDETGASINAEKISLAGKTIELTSDDITINSTNFQVDKNGNITANNVTLNSGTFKGDVNTSQNCYVGDNLYVGQNQSSSYSSVKKIKFSDNVEIGKLKIGNTEALSLYSPFLNFNGKEGTNIHYEYNNTQYTNGTLSRNMFYLSCLEDGVYILGDQNGISLSQQPYWPSDKKLKQEIKNIDTSWIDELKIKEFEYIKSPNKKQIGLIAQDYIDKDYSKYFLNQNEEGYYGISYGNITNALIQYCQEMKKEINSLKEEIKQLKEENK